MIYLSLLAFSYDPGLRQGFYTQEDPFLRKSDYADPDNSKFFEGSRFLVGHSPRSIPRWHKTSPTSKRDRDDESPPTSPAVRPTSAPVAAIPVVPPALPLADMVEYSLASIAEIRTHSGIGTGFIGHDSRLVITNKHVVEGNGQVDIRLATGGNYQGSVLSNYLSLDLAYIEIDSGATLKPLALGVFDADVAPHGNTYAGPDAATIPGMARLRKGAGSPQNTP